MTLDIQARGFPRELDGHPQLHWMGEDWVTHVVLALRERLVAQDPGGELRIVRCTGEPALETRVDPDGYVSHVRLRVHVTLLMRDGSQRYWWLAGPATFASDGTVAFEIEETRPGSAPLYAEHRCSVCGEVAARVYVEGGLRRETFTGTLTQASSPAIEDALHDAAALHAIDPELAPFFCPECAVTYCGGHWHRWDVFDPETGFHDQIRGRCPNGHERMLED